VHGSMLALKKALTKAAAIDARGDWVGGKLVVVIVGDFLDRGDDEIAIMKLIDSLKKQAEEAGGALHVLNGNHEVANVEGRFMEVSERGFADFAAEVTPAELKLPYALKFKRAHRARAVAFRPGGPRATWLAANPTVLIVGDTVFVHGGVTPEHVEYGLGRINKELKDWMLGKTKKRPDWLLGREGPFWLRDYSKDPDEKDCKRLEKTLKLLGAARMVVGHTIQPHINASCGGKVWKIDTGMNPVWFKGPIEVLEIKGDKVSPLR
jgi:hypothetical protein